MDNANYNQMQAYLPQQTPFTETDSHCRNCEGLKAHFTEQINNLKEYITSQNTMMLELLTEHSEMLNKLICRDLQFGEQAKNYTPQGLGKNKREFPLEATEDLAKMNQAMSDDDSTVYVNKMKVAMSRSPKNPLLAILSQQMVMDYNLDGTHGKKRLKDHAYFYSALKEAFYRDPTIDAEDDLRKAIQKVKKQHFLKVCLTRRKLLRNSVK